MTGFNSKRQMAQDKEALKLALEALETADETEFWNKQKEAITVIKEALAQPAQEPEPDELTIVYMSGLYNGKKAEREACAKLCEAMNHYVDDGEEFAAAIRARGNT
jgi:hypothetical protein